MAETKKESYLVLCEDTFFKAQLIQEELWLKSLTLQTKIQIRLTSQNILKTILMIENKNAKLIFCWNETYTMEVYSCKSVIQQLSKALPKDYKVLQIGSQCFTKVQFIVQTTQYEKKYFVKMYQYKGFLLYYADEFNCWFFNLKQLKILKHSVKKTLTCLYLSIQFKLDSSDTMFLHIQKVCSYISINLQSWMLNFLKTKIHYLQSDWTFVETLPF